MIQLSRDVCSITITLSGIFYSGDILSPPFFLTLPILDTLGNFHVLDKAFQSFSSLLIEQGKVPEQLTGQHPLVEGHGTMLLLELFHRLPQMPMSQAFGGRVMWGK